MSVRTKIVLSLLLVAVICAPAMWVLHRATLVPRLEALDRDAAGRDMERVVYALSREVEHLSLLCTDWGIWDDTYDFLATRSPDYIDANLGFDTFANVDVELIAMYDAEGRLFWGRFWDTEEEELLMGDGGGEPVPPFRELLPAADSAQAAHGLVGTAAGLTLLASQPVLPSSGEGAPRGTIIMGRRVEAPLLETIARNTRVDVSQETIAAATKTPDTYRVHSADPEWAGAVIAIGPVEGGAVSSLAAIPDVSGRPALGLRAATPSTVTTEGQRAVRWATIAVAVLVAVLLGAVALVLERLVGRRIVRLSADVSAASLDEGTPPCVREEGSDEIASLARVINRTFSALQEALLALRASQARLVAFFNSSAVGAAVLGPTWHYLYVNHRWADMLGCTADDVAGHHIRYQLAPGDAEALQTRWDAIAAGESDTYRAEACYVRIDGNPMWVDSSICAIRAADGELEAVMAVYVDVTERRQMEDQLRVLSLHDPLTGLPNRRAFDDHFDREWRLSMRLGLSIGLLLIDVDWFKLFNDTYGHPAGDECLRRVGDALRGAFVRATDFVARWGGEEFAIVVTGGDESLAGRLAEKAREAIEAAHIARPGQDPDHVTVSVGGATIAPSPGTGLSMLTNAADGALYRSKGEGRDRSTVVAL